MEFARRFAWDLFLPFYIKIPDILEYTNTRFPKGFVGRIFVQRPTSFSILIRLYHGFIRFSSFLKNQVVEVKSFIILAKDFDLEDNKIKFV